MIEKNPKTPRLKYFCAIYMIPKYWAQYHVFEISNWLADKNVRIFPLFKKKGVIQWPILMFMFSDALKDP